MKKILFLVLLAAAGCASSETKVQPVSKLYPAPESVPTNPAPEAFVYDQKPIASQPILIAPEQAQAVVEKFKAAYVKLGSPRMLLYVNRELVDEKTGVKLIARTEKTESSRRKIDSTIDAQNQSSNPVTITAGGNVTVNGTTATSPGKGKISETNERASNENRYRIEERNSPLADRQTVRDVERLFGRPLRAAGVSLADQGVATQLIADRSIKSFVVNPEGEAARKDRDALAKITDVAIEVLISSRNINAPEISGTQSYSVPDIQATAISLKDSKIIGQASSRDVLGKDRYAGRVARNFDVQDIAEATALALMEDMATSAK
ncbi:MAG: hypothetical protein ABJC04_11500 [Verrucomicrobiota bacterium]